MIEHIHQQFTIPREFHSQRIDAVLAQLLPDYSRSQISLWIKAGAITMNNKPCKPKDKTLDGDLVIVSVDFDKVTPDFRECEPENIPLDIIFEDEELLVLNKPAGLVVHPGAGNRDHTLVNALIYHAPELVNLPRAGIIHRLDKDTTGLLIVAKSLIAHTALIRQMQAREIQRNYLTFVVGHLISGGTIDTGFGRDSRNRLKMSVTGQGRQAITHYTIKKQYKEFTLLDVKLMTGRTHQIRVHLAHINHPVFGDPLYNGRMRYPSNASEEFKKQIQHFKRQALHAYTLELTHPITKEELNFQAPLPNDFKELLLSFDTHYDN